MNEDLELAVQTAVYAALAAAASIPVFQHIPDEQDPPYQAIGDMSSEPEGGKGSVLDRIRFDVVTVVAPNAALGIGAGREFLTPHMTTARTAIEDQALPAQPGVELSPPMFEGSEGATLPDGQTYVGVQRFSLLAQPA